MPLTPNGLVIRSFAEVLAQIESDEKTNVHPDMDTRDDEYIGQTNNILALMSQEYEQTAQAVIDNLDPDLAEGLWLDKLVAERSITRLIATPSSTTSQTFAGSDGTLIPSLTRVRSTITQNEYQTIADITITSSAALQAVIKVSPVLDSTVYSVTVNSTAYSTTSDGTATALEVLEALRVQIAGDGAATWTATLDTPNEELTIVSDTIALVSFTLGAYLTFASVTVLGYVEAVESGAKVDVIGSISILLTSVAGLTSVTSNLTDVDVGRELETDEELRIRLYSSANISSVAVPSAILSRIQDTEGVSVANLTENLTAFTVNNIPAHAYEVVVVGGTDLAIATELWLTKPAGIATYGSTSFNITDSQGIEQTLQFTRPSAFNVAFRIAYTTYNEEVLSSNIDTIIRDSLNTVILAQAIGEDVIPQRYIGDIFSNSTGLSTLTIEIQQLTNANDAPVGGAWQTTPLAVAATQYAATNDTDITII